MRRRSDCHPDKEHQARGLCAACYYRWKKDNLPGYRERQQRNVRAYFSAKVTPERRRAFNYRITQEERARHLAEANGCCRICTRSDVELVIDHSHATGAVRGMLCRRCNQGLGLFLDDSKLMRKAAGYLENSGKLPSVSEGVVENSQVGSFPTPRVACPWNTYPSRACECPRCKG